MPNQERKDSGKGPREPREWFVYFIILVCFIYLIGVAAWLLVSEAAESLSLGEGITVAVVSATITVVLLRCLSAIGIVEAKGSGRIVRMVLKIVELLTGGGGKGPGSGPGASAAGESDAKRQPTPKPSNENEFKPCAAIAETNPRRPGRPLALR